MTHENLKGRVAVVTGGGGVLCGQFAKTLAKQGCKVAVLDLNEAAAQACADEIVANGGEAIAVGCRRSCSKINIYVEADVIRP